VIDRAPDLVAPLLGWRAWNVAHTSEGWRLYSTHMGDLWPTGAPLEARCYRERVVAGGLSFHVRHEPPYRTCQCGVYGALSPEQASQYFVPSWADISPLPAPELDDEYVPRAAGRVQLWGRVLECSQGYRAMKAYPAQIFLPAHRPDGKPFNVAAVALDLLSYGVPVDLIDVRTRVEIRDRLGREGGGASAEPA
jgi:hypothetical protein